MQALVLSPFPFFRGGLAKLVCSLNFAPVFGAVLQRKSVAKWLENNSGNYLQKMVVASGVA